MMVLSVYSLASFVQKDTDASEVPAAVLDAFTAEFADVRGVE